MIKSKMTLLLSLGLLFLLGCTQPPTNPTGFSARVLSPTSVALNWAAASGASGYVLERKPGEASSTTPFAVVATLTALTYTDTGLSPKTPYTYRLKAKNGGGYSGAALQTVTTLDLLPGVPSLSTTLQPGGVKLSWVAADGGTVNSYTLERGLGTNPSSYTVLYSGSALSFSDSTACNTLYSYRLRASNATGSSDWTLKTVLTLPDNPVGLSAEPLSPSQIQLSWQAPAATTGEYTVERKQGTAYIQLAVTSQTSYSDTALSANTLYQYRIKVRTQAGSSPGSEVSATTLSATLKPPVQFYANTLTSQRVVLAWQGDGLVSADYLVIERKKASEARFSLLTHSESGYYLDTAIEPATSYLYRIKAVNASGSSPWKELALLTPGDSGYRILFVGNSRTGYNDIPGLVRQMALADGRQPEIGYVVLYGRSLEDQWNELIPGESESQAVHAIKEGNWDVVVLQELSIQPVENCALFYQYVRQFTSLIRAQGAQPLLFLNWRHLGYSFTQADMNAANYQIADEQTLAVAPVGVAWEASSAQYPGIQLFNPDGNHAELAGSYLAAGVLYASLYDRPPKPITAALSSTVMTQLNSLAWETYTGQAAQYRLPGPGMALRF